MAAVSVGQTFIDSGCSRSMFGTTAWFEDGTYRSDDRKVYLGDGSFIQSIGSGDVVIKRGTHKITLHDCMHVPRLAGNLVSISHLVFSNVQVVFDTKGCRVERGGQVLDVVPTKDRMYAWDVRPANDHALSSQHQETKSLDENLVHRRFGHVNMTALRQTCALVDGLKMNLDTFVSCDSCTLGKMTRRTFKTSTTSPTTFKPGELLSMDLFGPLPTSRGGHHYGLIIVDKSSAFVKLYLLKMKSETRTYVERFLDQSATMHGRKTKVVRSDNGGEFKSQAFVDMLKRRGITPQYTTPHTPEQNGQAERMVRTVKEGTRTLLLQANLGTPFWGAAAKSFVFARNRTFVRGRIPEEAWTGKKVSVDNLRVFGCVAYYHVPGADRRTLDPTSVRGIFLGYGEEDDGTKAWIVYDPKTRRAVRSASVTFKEGQRWSTEKANLNEMDDDNDDENFTSLPLPAQPDQPSADDAPDVDGGLALGFASSSSPSARGRRGRRSAAVPSDGTLSLAGDPAKLCRRSRRALETEGAENVPDGLVEGVSADLEGSVDGSVLVVEREDDDELDEAEALVRSEDEIEVGGSEHNEDESDAEQEGEEVGPAGPVDEGGDGPASPQTNNGSAPRRNPARPRQPPARFRSAYESGRMATNVVGGVLEDGSESMVVVRGEDGSDERSALVSQVGGQPVISPAPQMDVLRVDCQPPRVPSSTSLPDDVQTHELPVDDDTTTVLQALFAQPEPTTVSLNHERFLALAAVHQEGVPTRLKEALMGPDADEWRKGAEAEMASLRKHEVWELVPRPPGVNIVGCREVLAEKKDARGKTVRYKVRIVAQGFSQRPGEDFDETFAPVVKFTTLRALLSQAAVEDWEVHQMDVETAFLYGELHERVYMVQPRGFEEKGKEDWVCRLKKGLYGLKQAARQWYLKLHEVLTGIGFFRSDADQGLYTIRLEREVLHLAVYGVRGRLRALR